MPFNGSGNHSRVHDWETDKAAAVKITASRMDAEFDDISTALDNCITRDGQSPATANIPMGGFLITGLGTANSGDDALSRDAADARYGWAASALTPDNSLVRVDGTSRGIQTSVATLSDAGILGGVTRLNVTDGAVNVYATTSGGIGYIGTSTDDYLYIKTNTVTAISIADVTGLHWVGIGLADGTAPAKPLHVSREDNSNTVVHALRLQHTVSVAPANGIGVGIDFVAETTASNNETGMTLEAIVTDNTAGAEDFDFVLKLMDAGNAATEKMRVNSVGVLTLTDETVSIVMAPNTTLGSIGTSSNHPFYLQANNTTAMILGTAGQISVTDGSAGAPVYSNIGDENTGIYFPAADSIGISCAGAAVGAWNTTGLSIGHTAGSATYPLYIQHADNVARLMVMENTNAGSSARVGFRLINDAGTQVNFQLSSAAGSFATPVLSSTIGMGITVGAASTLPFLVSTTQVGIINNTGFAIGSAANATTATGPFLYISSSAGPPTGVPTGNTGRVAFTYDTTNNRLYAYNGAWRMVAVA